ncbi:hypothetical protein QJS10_CPB17g01516 [Acorus calamus]|uniref:Glucosamine inositolphosphorylceramide transferase 1 N-terminal domain-containing protein n=1 Tax=Acorus calamus TaxID=4465 RepID=A0AAV9CWC6_ACOCL|nr:hypothetical protein QJS10_CPB17g01516 [Acorus calamus]
MGRVLGRSESITARIPSRSPPSKCVMQNLKHSLDKNTERVEINSATMLCHEGHSEPTIMSCLEDSALYLFFETKTLTSKQGDIGVARSIDHGATWEYLGIALDEEWHLSYPYVFKYNDQVYMMPEGSKNGDLRLYLATGFPLQWTPVKVLLKRPLVDATMIHHDGLYWIFGSDFSRFGTEKNAELEIWYSDSPLGSWRQHKKNPIYRSDRSLGARNGGGHLFMKDIYTVRAKIVVRPMDEESVSTKWKNLQKTITEKLKFP